MEWQGFNAGLVELHNFATVKLRGVHEVITQSRLVGSKSHAYWCMKCYFAYQIHQVEAFHANEKVISIGAAIILRPEMIQAFECAKFIRTPRRRILKTSEP